MKKFSILFLIFIFNTGCIQNITKCPMDTITLKKECSNDKNKDEQNQLLFLGIALNSSRLSSNSSSNSSGILSGKALEFYNILESYRRNGSYTLTNGTTNIFLNSSRCSGSTLQNTPLNRAAQKHNDNMVRLNFFSHTGQDGSTPSTRVMAEGLNVGAGENIAAGVSTAEGTFDQWWKSSGHRANMENCNYTHVGIGYTAKETVNSSANYSHYWTNVFATIR